MGSGSHYVQVSRRMVTMCCPSSVARLLLALLCASALAFGQDQQQQWNASVPCSHDDDCPLNGDPSAATSCCGVYGCCTLGAHSTLLSSQHRLSGQCAEDYAAQYGRCLQLIVHCTNTGQRLADCTQAACLPADDTDCCGVEHVAMTKCTAMAVFREGAAQVQSVCVPRSCLASRQMDAVMENFNGLTCAIVGDPERLEFCPIDSIMTQCNDGTSVSCHMTSSACKTVYADTMAPPLSDNGPHCNWTATTNPPSANTPSSPSPTTMATSAAKRQPMPSPTAAAAAAAAAATSASSEFAIAVKATTSIVTSFPTNSPTMAREMSPKAGPAVGTASIDNGQQKNVGSRSSDDHGETVMISAAVSAALLFMATVMVAVVGVRKCRRYHRDAVELTSRYVPMQDTV